MKELITIKTEELNQIEKVKALNLINAFVPYADTLNSFFEEYSWVIKEAKEEINEASMFNAKQLRLKILKVRTGSQAEKKKQKEESLKYGRAIDSLGNLFKDKISTIEEELKEIENHFITKEKERLRDLREQRFAFISPYIEIGTELPILENMNQDVFEAYCIGKKKAYKDRIDAEIKAEEELIAKEKAEREEQERIRKENEQLKAEAEERERVEQERLAKEEAILIAERAERVKIEIELLERKEKEETERKEREAILKAEREERERVEQELQERKEEEARIIKEEAERKEEELQKELSKGDEEKIKDLINDFKLIKTKYEFKSKENKTKYKKICDNSDKCIEYLEGK